MRARPWLLPLRILVVAALAIGAVAALDRLLGLREPLLFSVAAVPVVAVVAFLVDSAIRRWLG